MALSLRARFTLFFTSSISALLLLAFVAVHLGHERSRLDQIDVVVARTESLVARLIASDLDEGTPLATAAKESIEELDLASFRVSVLDGNGVLVAGNAGEETQRSGARGADAPSLKARTETSAQGRVRVVRAIHTQGTVIYELSVGQDLGPLDNELAILGRVLAGSLVVSLLLAAILGTRFAGTALRPVTFMAEQARAIKGDTRGERLPFGQRADELGALATAFNGLLDRVDQALAQQRQFMTDASHELRTPVSVARVATEVTLANSVRSEQEYQDCLRVVNAQVSRLGKIVEDLFALARADAAPVPLQVQGFYVDELLASCVNEARVLAALKETEITLTGASDVEMRGDERLLGQMVANLLDNAVRHGPRQGRVHVHLTRTDNACEVSVEDGNEPIPASERERVFDRFVRLDPARTGSGAGLGLSIARAITTAHGGSLFLKGGESGGNTFVATLPLDARPKVAAVTT